MLDTWQQCSRPFRDSCAQSDTQYSMQTLFSALTPLFLSFFQTFNRCHFWSNFELGDLRWFRSSQYQVSRTAPEKASVLTSSACAAL